MEIYKGYVESIVFRNDETQYTVLEVTIAGRLMHAVGSFEEVFEGESVEITGESVIHPLYGEQIKVHSVKAILPEDTVSMCRYLGSGAIKGIGEAMAQKIVQKFGEDTFRIIEEEPERLSEIKGISEKKARSIAIQFEEKKSMRDAMIFLEQYGIKNRLAVKIFTAYGNEVYSIVKTDPYRLADDIDGVGFRRADEIASRIGISRNSEFRVRCGIMYVLTGASAEGNLFLPYEELIAKSCELLQVDADEIASQTENLSVLKKIRIIGSRERAEVYPSQNYYTELSAARTLLEIQAAAGNASEEERRKVLSEIEELGTKSGLVLDEMQKEAVLGALLSGVFILSGGPGTGKTTTTRMIIDYLKADGQSFYLAAPTGRAAKRMEQATGYEARTIHRMLELSARDENDTHVRFERNESNPLEVDAIIIDEMSMVDIFLFSALLKAVMPGTKLIMVGDSSQLPSVGPGQVLRDLIESGLFKTVILQKIFRQAGESDIVMNAHRINNGEEPLLNNKSKDFFFVESDNPSVIGSLIVKHIKGKLPEYVNAKPFDVQVLTPMKKGLLGTIELNRLMQESLNPPDKKKKEFETGDILFREGDKVMQIKNDYQLEWEVKGLYGIPVSKGTGVFNGDTGILTNIDTALQTLTVRFDEGRCVTYPFSLADELEPAYAVTIHKSQGSEYPAVIIPLLGVPSMLRSRNILYTGITRAKGCVLLLGSRETVFDMIENDKVWERYSGLKNRLLEIARVQDDNN